MIFSAAIVNSGNISKALAQNTPATSTLNEAAMAKIQYPVAELGNCQNQTDCKVYCDKIENRLSCLNFAQKNGLMDSGEISRAKKFISLGKGPGGCTSQDSCEAYCNDISHIDECVSFAEKNGFLSQDELNQAKKVQNAIKSGIKPPCNNKQECDVYCSNPNNMEVCVKFAEAAGIMTDQEQQDAEKVLSAIKKGVTPPPCKGKEACDAYCSDPAHMEVCITFAQAAGFLNAQEAQDSQKVLTAIKNGVTPPPCKSKEECDAYCSQEGHSEQCIKFAAAAGLISPQDAEIIKKTGDKGPGGCTSKDSCEAFCNTAANQAVCLGYAKEHNLISAEDIQKMQEGDQSFINAINNSPAAAIDCIKGKIGADQFDKIKSGTEVPPRNIGDIMQACFKQSMGARGQEMPQGQYAPEEKNSQNASGTQNNFIPANAMPFNLDSLPEAERNCVKSSLGENFADKIKTGELNPVTIGDTIKKCVQNSMSDQSSQAAPVTQENMQIPNIPQGVNGDIIKQYIQQGTQQMVPGAITPPAAPQPIQQQMP